MLCVAGNVDGCLLDGPSRWLNHYYPQQKCDGDIVDELHGVRAAQDDG